MSDQLPARRDPPFDHAIPLDPDALVRRSRLAEALGVPTAYSADGRLARVVMTYVGSLEDLVRRLGRFQLDVPAPLPDGSIEIEGCRLWPLPAEGVVLCGHVDDIQETFEVEGRLEWLLSCYPHRRRSPGLSKPKPAPRIKASSDALIGPAAPEERRDDL